MTNQEAGGILENLEADYRDLDPLVLTNDSIKLVNERIEALGVANSALKKQIPMKTLAPELGISPRHPIIIPCGNCGMELADRMQNYCPWCGQAIDWEE